MAKDIKTQVEKELPEFADTVKATSSEDINTRLAGLAKDAEDVRQTKEDDEELKEARETAKQANAPYVDAMKVIRLKTRYLLAILKERGQS